MSSCLFCAIVAGRAPATVLAREELCVAILDLFPVAPGHALVVPVAHAATLAELPLPDRQALFRLAGEVLAALRRSGLPCAGANLLLNDGRAANQSIPHVHVHVVPRRPGDLPRLVARLAARALRGFGRPASARDLERAAAAIRPHLEPPASS